MNKRLTFVLVVLCLIVAACAPAKKPDDLKAGFVKPPDSARPWVYWFWLNGNITREGITADLEAMKRVGIGGVLIMEVDQGAPVGPVAFMGAAVARAVQARRRRGAAAGPRGQHEQRRRLERQRRAVDHARAVDAEGRLDRDRGRPGPAQFEGDAAAAARRSRILSRHRGAGLPDAGRLSHRRTSRARRSTSRRERRSRRPRPSCRPR